MYVDACPLSVWQCRQGGVSVPPSLWWGEAIRLNIMQKASCQKKLCSIVWNEIFKVMYKSPDPHSPLDEHLWRYWNTPRWLYYNDAIIEHYYMVLIKCAVDTLTLLYMEKFGFSSWYILIIYRLVMYRVDCFFFNNTFILLTSCTSYLFNMAVVFAIFIVASLRNVTISFKVLISPL